MHHVNHTKRYRGTGLYRNHSRRRGDKETHIRELILQAEEAYNLAMSASDGERQSEIDKALLHYQSALALINTLHVVSPHAHEEQAKIRTTIMDRMQKIRLDGSHS